MKPRASRHTGKKLHRADTAAIDLGIGIGVGYIGGGGGGSVSDSEVPSLAGSTEQTSFVGRNRLYQHQHSHHQHQAGPRGVRVRGDAGFGCPGQRRIMQSIRESPEVITASNSADIRYGNDICRRADTLSELFVFTLSFYFQFCVQLL